MRALILDEETRKKFQDICSPILALFRDDVNPAIVYAVTPDLQRVEGGVDSLFKTVGDVVDFVAYILEVRGELESLPEQHSEN